jgi:drug/metabolite transporter (DMT)-like permease
VLGAAPVVFVVLWSTGFVLARYATDDAGPLTFLAIRLAIAAAILWAVAAAIGAPRIGSDQAGWVALAGLGLHALYLGGVFVAVDLGLPTGLSALIAGLHPVVTSLAALALLGERLRPVQWLGVALGFAGVLAVVADRLQAPLGGVTVGALLAMGVAVMGMSAGTLVQRARGRTMPLLRGVAVQYGASAVVLGVGAVALEGFEVDPTARFWLSMAWAVGVLSIAAILLMVWLLQRQPAAQVSSLFFLTPALSTVEGAVLFGERLGMLALVGLVVAVVGVALTTRPNLRRSTGTWGTQ